MIEESGRVTWVQGDVARVECERRRVCGTCSAGGTCGTSLLERFFGRGEQTLSATDPIGVKPGDRVVVGVKESAVLEAAFVGYLMPLVSMIGIAILAAWLADNWVAGWKQELSVLGGFVGLTFGLAGLARYSDRRRRDERFRPVILRAGAAPGLEVSLESRRPARHRASSERGG